MKGLKDLLDSERGVFCVFVLVFATGFVLIGKLPVDAWLSFTKWLAGILVASKTVTTAIDSSKNAAVPEARVVTDRTTTDRP